MKEIIQQRLSKEILLHLLQIRDDSIQHKGHIGNIDGGGHYTALIVSDSFQGMTLLNRHKLVYQALGNLIGNEIHAFSMQTLTISEYQDSSFLQST